MSKGMNKVILIGNVGQDPELRETRGGMSVLSLRLATNERYKTSAGDWQDRAEWHSVVVWGKRAEALARFLKKGSKICVEGRLQTSSWEAQGQTKYKTEIVASEVILLDSRGGGGGGGQTNRTDYEQPKPVFGDDDVPF